MTVKKSPLENRKDKMKIREVILMTLKKIMRHKHTKKLKTLVTVKADKTRFKEP